MKRFDWLALFALVAVAAGCGSNQTTAGGGDASAVDSSDDSAGSGDGSMQANAEGGGFGADGSVSVNCTAFGGACSFGASCCSGICDTKAGTCASSIAACAPATAACAGNTDCCSGACVAGHCGGTACLTIGAACPVAGNVCCTGNCSGGKCASISPGASCVTADNTCTSNTQCCSGLCGPDGRCSLGSSYCIQTGDICYHANDCCGGICSAPNAQPVSATNPGVCSQPSSGATNCTAVDGTLCPGGNCGQCCSRLCAPYGPTGVNICQPAQGCRVEGDLCRTAADCCGGPATGGLGDGEVTCSNATNGAAVGVCLTPLPDGGGVCVPEGDVCHYNASNYMCATVSSARSDCCGPQTPKFDACVLDPFGVPRCNAYTGVKGGGIGCVAAGSGCAPATDCCNGNPCVLGSGGMLQCAATACQTSGQTCTTNADCCSGLPCVSLPGSIGGTCTPVAPPPPPPSDGGTTIGPDGGITTGPDGGSGYAPDGGYSCSLYGQQCSATSLCCGSVPCTNGKCLYPVQ